MPRFQPARPVAARCLPLLLLATLLSLLGGSVMEAATATLSVSITDTRLTAEPGDLLTYTLRLRNTDAVPLNNVRVRISLPTTVTFVAASDSPAALGGGVYEWSFASLAAGSTTFRYLSVQINTPLAPGTVISTTAAVDQLGDASANTATDTTTINAPTVSLDPASLSFADQVVNTTSPPQTVTLTNTGTAPLMITSITISGDFAQTNTCPSTLPVGASCTISVTFTPTAVGLRTGTLTVDDSAVGSPHTVSLSGNGSGPATSYDTTLLDFGTQRVGTTSASQTVTLTNTGAGPLTISALAASGDFTLESTTCPLGPATLAADASCTISVSFTPSALGTRSGTLTITSDAPSSPDQIALTGVGVEPQASVDPTSLTFGSQEVNTTSAPQTVTLRNTGTGPLRISSITISGDFARTNNCPSALAAGASCTISVTFSPTATGARTGALTISDDAAGSPRSVSLSGTGVQSSVALSPTSLDFGSQPINQTSAPQTVTLTNSGDAALRIDGLSASGDFAISSTSCPLGPATLAIDASCTISVTFTPTAAGARSGTLTITSNASGSPHTLGLTGTGLAPAVSLDPAALSFGTQRVGTTSAAQSVTLRNSGTLPLTISAISASGDFAVTGGDCPLGPNTLAIGASCTISVTFTPSATGARSGTLTIADDALDSPQTVALAGTGVEPGVYLSASSINFGTQRLSMPSLPRSLTLRNNGLDNLSITSIQTGGDYTQTNDCPAVLAPDASCTISVTFTPSMTGPRTATLTIADDAPGSPRSVSLSGLGAIIFNLPIDFKLFMPMLLQRP